MRKTILAWAILIAGAASAADSVVVGSAEYAPTATIASGGKAVKLTLTGAAMRQKVFVNVYAVASYVQEGAAVRGADDVAAADVPKQLQLVMQRDVAGKDMAEAFRGAIRLNYAEPTFQAEVETLVRMLRDSTVRKGDLIVLTHLPGVGLQVNVAGKNEFVVKNAKFSRAVWDIYLGPNNLGESIKKGLVSRL